MPSLDLMYQFERLALGWDQVKPAPRHHQVLGKSQHAVGDGIAVMMVTEQPRVNIAFAQRRLDGGQVHGQTSIANKGKEFGRIAAGEGCSSPRPELPSPMS